MIVIGNRPNKNLNQIIIEFKRETPIKQISKKYNISESQLYNLRRKWEDGDFNK